MAEVSTIERFRIPAATGNQRVLSARSQEGKQPIAKTTNDAETAERISAQPHFHQHAREIQAYGTVNHALSLELEEPVRLEMTEQNQLLADTITLRDLYKKSHWQVAGPTFNQLHLLYDKHYDEQVDLLDSIAERIQLLGGISLAMAADVAERPPRSSVRPVLAKRWPIQLSRLLDAHQVVIRKTRKLARRASQLWPSFTCCFYRRSVTGYESGRSRCGRTSLASHSRL